MADATPFGLSLGRQDGIGRVASATIKTEAEAHGFDPGYLRITPAVVRHVLAAFEDRINAQDPALAGRLRVLLQERGHV